MKIGKILLITLFALMVASGAVFAHVRNPLDGYNPGTIGTGVCASEVRVDTCHIVREDGHAVDIPICVGENRDNCTTVLGCRTQCPGVVIPEDDFHLVDA